MLRVRSGVGMLAAGLLAWACLGGAPEAGEKKADGTEKWVQLFNGQDLTGWKTHEGDKAKWTVKDGCIVGTGPAGHLYSQRGDYRDFRYRVKAKINDHGNSGQYFRARYARGFPPGYEAQINATHRDPIRTGSLYPAFNPKLKPEQRKALLVLKAPHEPDQWFTQEVIAKGNHIVIKVNGQTTVDFVDDNNTYTQGHFAIQQHDPGSVITIKNIEVIELSPRSGAEK